MVELTTSMSSTNPILPNLPVEPPENGVLLTVIVRDTSRDYQVRRQANHWELLSRLDDGTWLCDQDRFSHWDDVVEFFRLLRAVHVECLAY